MSSAGTKVTKDPEATQNAKVEAPGTLTSDSLAAESLNQSGSFAANDPHRVEPSSQPARGTTTNTTDTSGATTLAPAADAQARDGGAGDAKDVIDSGIGEGKAAGRGPTYNIVATQGTSAQTGGTTSTADKPSSTGGGSNASPSSSTNTSGSSVPTAPTAVHAHRMPGSVDKPHGKNLKAGDEGFEGNEENASFSGEIGTENDPGRLAENKMQQYSAQSGADAGGGPRQKEVTNDGQYEALGEEAA